MARRFVGTGAVAYECGKLYNGQVPSIGILNHGSDKSALSECATGGTAGEDLSGGGDSFGANRAESVATEEDQLTPPIKASARNQITGRRRRFSARNPRARRSLEGIFMR
jgi:hypothetical protein